MELEKQPIIHSLYFQIEKDLNPDMMSGLYIYIYFLLASCFSCTMANVSNKDLFELFQNEMLNAKAEQAVMELSDILLEQVEDRPKEIEITCPGNISPHVAIRELQKSSSSSAFDGSECMVLKMTGANFNFRLALNCEEIERTDIKFSETEEL